MTPAPSPEASADADAPLRRPGSPGELFRVFNRLSLQGFGGVLAVAQHHLVERERWLTRPQFVEMLSIGQVLPGPNVVNLSLMIGDRFFGWRGALAALAGMIALPLVIVLALTVLYGHYAQIAWVAGALRGMGAVSAGLVLSTAFKLAPTLGRNPLGRWACAAYVALTVGAVAVMHWPLVGVLAVLGGSAVAFGAWRLRPGAQTRCVPSTPSTARP